MIKPVVKFIVVGLVTLALFCVALEAFGTDIQKGYAFTPTDRVTNTKLNNLIDLATINTDFIHLQTAIAPAASDELLVYSSSSALFRKATVNNFLLGNTNLIMGQAEDAAPGTNDFILTYDVSAGSFKRVALYNVLPTGFNTMVIPPDINFQMLIRSNGVTYWTTMTNLLQQEYRFSQLANNSNSVSDPTNYFLANNGLPVKTDALVLWSGNTNKYTTLSNLVTQATAATTVTLGDFITGFSTNDSQFVKYTVAQIQNFVTNSAKSPTLAYRQIFTTQGVALANGPLVNGAHGLGGIPQSVRWVLVATALDGGWGIGREVPVESFCDSATGKPWFTTEADSTALNVVAANTGTMQVRHSVSGIATNATQSSWTLKGYAIYFP